MIDKILKDIKGLFKVQDKVKFLKQNDRQAWASATAQMDLIATGQTTPEEAVEGFKEEMKNIYPEIEID